MQTYTERPTPALDRARKLITFAEADLALRSKDFVQGQWDAPAACLVHDTVSDLDFEPHFLRRRLESVLFRKEALDHYELTVLVPALRNELALARQGADHAQTVDLLPLV